MREAGAGFRSIAEPMVDTTSPFAEVIIAVLGVAASYSRNLDPQRRHRRPACRASANRAAADSTHHALGQRGPYAPPPHYEHRRSWETLKRTERFAKLTLIGQDTNDEQFYRFIISDLLF